MMLSLKVEWIQSWISIWEQENIIAIEDFKLCLKNVHLEATCENFDPFSSINKPTCGHSSSPTFNDLNVISKRNFSKLYEPFETDQIFLNHGASRGKLKKNYVDHTDNLTSNILTNLKINFETQFLIDLNRYVCTSEIDNFVTQ